MLVIDSLRFFGGRNIGVEVLLAVFGVGIDTAWDIEIALESRLDLQQALIEMRRRR